MWLCFCVALALPPAMNRAAAAQIGVNAQTHTTVLVLGDSLSAAYGIAAHEGWVTLLQSKLAALQPPYRVVNASISGETTAGGRSRLRRLLNQHAPAVVVIALGANDGLRGLPPVSIEANLHAMAGAAGAQGAKLVLAGMRLPPNYGASYDAQFRAVFTRVAQRHGAALVPFLLEGFADKRELFQSDGLHPTAAAQGLILQTMWPSIQRSLQGTVAADAQRRSAGQRAPR
jgi:acyl-CoA thioesterase I